MGGPCLKLQFPDLSDDDRKPDPSFVINCAYSGAYHALNFLYSNSLVAPPNPTAPYRGTLQPFEQYRYLPSIQGATGGFGVPPGVPPGGVPVPGFPPVPPGYPGPAVPPGYPGPPVPPGFPQGRELSANISSSAEPEEKSERQFVSSSSFDPNGFLYVPPGCQNPAVPCRLHVVFHGCFMGA